MGSANAPVPTVWLMIGAQKRPEELHARMLLMLSTTISRLSEGESAFARHSRRHHPRMVHARRSRLLPSSWRQGPPRQKKKEAVVMYAAMEAMALARLLRACAVVSWGMEKKLRCTRPETCGLSGVREWHQEAGSTWRAVLHPNVSDLLDLGGLDPQALHAPHVQLLVGLNIVPPGHAPFQ